MAVPMMTSHFDVPTVQFEGVKVALKQDKSGYLLTLSVHPDDIPEDLIRDFVGARYQVVMVRLNEDQTPYPREKKPRNGVVAAAGILCRDPMFWKWLKHLGEIETEDEASAVEALHRILGIDSRASLANPVTQEQYDLLRAEYNRWCFQQEEPPF